MTDDDDIEFCDEQCPKCKARTTYTRPCYAGCDEGWFDGYEDDPLWYSPGDYERCDQCLGHGFHHWCRACGWDFHEKRYLGGGGVTGASVRQDSETAQKPDEQSPAVQTPQTGEGTAF